MKEWIKSTLIAVLGISAFIACENSDSPTNINPSLTTKVPHVTANFDGDDAQVFIQPAEDLTSGKITFINKGYHLNPVRSARVFTDDLGWVYVYDYGGGYLQKLSYNDGSYSKVRELDITSSMGNNAHVRPWKINEETILIHNINTADIEDSGNGITKEAKLYVTRVQIPEVSIWEIMDTWTVPVSNWDEEEQAYPYRVDAPTVLDGKIYYGVGRRQLNDSISLTGMHTIVIDYPTLKNPKYIRTTLGNGNTNGYRGMNMHAYDGYVYQCNAANAENPTIMVRLKDGQYDESWSFNINDALGEPVSTNNWYAAGGGIYYMPANFLNETDENNTWGLLRVDLNKKSVIKMDVPMSNMRKYQRAQVIDGKFHIVISPVGGTPKNYIFDMDSEESDAFTEGVEFDSGNIFIEGIF